MILFAIAGTLVRVMRNVGPEILIAAIAFPSEFKIGEPTQRTPKGLEIPVPKRKDVDESIRKLVQPVKKKP